MNTYVGTDGKLHFVNSAGADSVLNFSSGSTSGTLTLNLSGSTAAERDDVTGTASISGNIVFAINMETMSVTVTNSLTLKTVAKNNLDGKYRTSSKTPTATHTFE